METTFCVCLCVYVFCIRLALKHLSSQQINLVIRPQSACATLHIRVTITLRSPNKSSLPPCRSPSRQASASAVVIKAQRSATTKTTIKIG